MIQQLGVEESLPRSAERNRLSGELQPLELDQGSEAARLWVRGDHAADGFHRPVFGKARAEGICRIAGLIGIIASLDEPLAALVLQAATLRIGKGAGRLYLPLVDG